MPLLILLAMLMILGIISIFEDSGKRNEPLTKEELDDVDWLPADVTLIEEIRNRM